MMKVMPSVVTNSYGRTINTYGINPFIQWDTKYVGTGIGFHSGDLLIQTKHPNEESIDLQSRVFWSSVKNTHFYPQAYIRLGRVDKIFGEMSFARNFPSSFPDLVFQTNIGFSVKYNKLNSGVVRLGTSTIHWTFHFVDVSHW